LEKNLKKVKGIETVDIDMKTGKATVAFKPGVQVNDQTLRQAVKKSWLYSSEYYATLMLLVHICMIDE